MLPLTTHMDFVSAYVDLTEFQLPPMDYTEVDYANSIYFSFLLKVIESGEDYSPFIKNFKNTPSDVLGQLNTLFNAGYHTYKFDLNWEEVGYARLRNLKYYVEEFGFKHTPETLLEICSLIPYQYREVQLLPQEVQAKLLYYLGLSNGTEIQSTTMLNSLKANFPPDIHKTFYNTLDQSLYSQFDKILSYYSLHKRVITVTEFFALWKLCNDSEPYAIDTSHSRDTLHLIVNRVLFCHLIDCNPELLKSKLVDSVHMKFIEMLTYYGRLDCAEILTTPKSGKYLKSSTHDLILESLRYSPDILDYINLGLTEDELIDILKELIRRDSNTVTPTNFIINMRK